MFSGSADGYLYAFDAKTGAVKWKSPQMSSGVIGVPSTWKVGDKQYVGVWAGWGGCDTDLGRRYGEGPCGEWHSPRRAFVCVRPLMECA